MLRIRRSARTTPVSNRYVAIEGAVVDCHPSCVETLNATGVAAFHHDAAHDPRLAGAEHGSELDDLIGGPADHDIEAHLRYPESLFVVDMPVAETAQTVAGKIDRMKRHSLLELGLEKGAEFAR